MTGGILILGIIIFGLQILFGKGKVETYFHFLIWLVFALILLSIGYNYLLCFWLGLPMWAQILIVLLLPFFISALLKMIFPKAKWLQALQAVVFQTLIYVITFPLRFLWRAGRFLLQRERLTVRLNPYRSVVGNRPPIVVKRERLEDRNNPFGW